MGLLLLLASKVHSLAAAPPSCLQAEYRALNHVFPHENLRMNSTKSMIGHLLGGAGAVEAVATVQVRAVALCDKCLLCACVYPVRCCAHYLKL